MWFELKFAMNRAGKLCRKLPVLVFGSLNCRGHEENRVEREAAENRVEGIGLMVAGGNRRDVLVRGWSVVVVELRCSGRFCSVVSAETVW